MPPLLRLVLLSLALMPGLGWAQTQAPADSVGRRAVPRLERTRVVVVYDSRYSIINYKLTTINGLKLGVELKNRMRMGGAIYFLSTGVPTRQPRPDNADEDAPAELRFRYLAGYGEYVLLENRRWELSTQLQLGLGSAQVAYTTEEGAFTRTPREFLGVVEPSFTGHVRVFRWAGVGAGAGWRQPIFVPLSVQKELNGPVFYVRAKLFLGDLLQVVRGKERLFSQDGLRD
ncbi:hypothetical protein [Hymenobacter arizonensis]|uniref:DUF3108 domain-containing protein n=1 Tax=Hymenobacter arizonensis TaxID=1227077 RepID=A0A1I5SK11_HYMAR|nr:hypothetical protein [Hymenobacter arizonensis]SFP71058.1 hypothetical protein SAMN04515668_0087 [Hymenobacter arizonensis]